MNIWVPRTKIIEASRELALPCLAKFGGFYKMEAIRPDGRRRVVADWFPNLITNGGLDRMATAAFMPRCVVGAGNATPAFTDTQLQTFLASTTTTQSSSAAAGTVSPYISTLTTVYRFAAGVAAGNLSEVGIGWADNALFSRALILDGVGNPTTITILSDEVLDISYQLRKHPNLVDASFNATISGVVYSCTSRPAQVNSNGRWQIIDGGITGSSAETNTYPGTLGAVTSVPSGTAAVVGTVTHASYTNGNKYRDATITWGLTAGNAAGGIKAITFGVATNSANNNMGKWQVEFNPVIPKDGTKTLALTVRTAWDRV